MTKNVKIDYNVRKEIIQSAVLTNECGCCGTPCLESDDFCSKRCESKAQGGTKKIDKRLGWDG